MKNTVATVISLIAFICAICVGSFLIGYHTADNAAFHSVCNTEQTDILELLIENDTDAEVITAYYDYQNGKGYIVLKDNEKNDIYGIKAEVKKYAPCRYEWTVIEND